MIKIASYDIDGVIFLGFDFPWITPRKMDIIITGRSFEEERETNDMLLSRGILNKVFFNPLKFDSKTRESSGIHKAKTIEEFNKSQNEFVISVHFDDDPIQISVIKERLTELEVVEIRHSLVDKENVRHIR